MRYGVVGYGVVGKHMVRDIESAGQEARFYDPLYPAWSKDDINACDCAFVCVPTPLATDGILDMSVVRDVFTWLRVPVAIIRSALAIGTADNLAFQGHHVVVSPEFIGEGVRPPYVQMAQPPFMILGGHRHDTATAIQCLSRLYNSECEFITMTAREAEITKLCENYFLALKVSWANEVYEICSRFGASYDAVMGGLVHDYRIGRSHTHVYRDKRGWSSKCFDKDLPGLLGQASDYIAPLLAKLLDVNEWHKTRSEK